MEEYTVQIPDESYNILQFKEKEKPGIAIVNVALQGFEPKVVFGWHLSVLIELETILDNGLPSKEEYELLAPFEEQLDEAIKSNPDLPNALFLSIITWNKTRELTWRVNNPEIAHQYLQLLIEENQFPRPFSYRIDPDEEWKLAGWHLQNHENANPSN